MRRDHVITLVLRVALQTCQPLTLPYTTSIINKNHVFSFNTYQELHPKS